MMSSSISSGWTTSSSQSSKVWSDHKAEARQATKAVQARKAADEPAAVKQNWPAAQSQWSSMGKSLDTYM
jgi:hypothetical protein